MQSKAFAESVKKMRRPARLGGGLAFIRLGFRFYRV